MSNAMLNACKPLRMAPAQKGVLIALADAANADGRTWISIPTICEFTCYGRTAVIDALKQLEASGAIEVRKEIGKATQYLLTPQKHIDQSASRTGSRGGRVREANCTRPGGGLDPSGRRTRPPAGPVREADSTRPPAGLDPSASRTGPVRQPDPNPKEPHNNKSTPVSGADEREAGEAGAPSAPEPHVTACQAMVKAGIPASFVHPSNSTLHELIAAGHPPEEFARAAALALATKSPRDAFGYAIGIVRNGGGKARASPGTNGTSRPSATDSFKDTTYVGTPVENLSPELRRHLEQSATG
ncbi:helix-turn-helix domain-containing protein [Dyella lutea]|uniref:Helix-turn-helix domain-containing protein n=1 Tax=Dyella lutea TaxID=2950441 RepID=A0ABT1FFA4_9GAMM|nr:helix-turn-helix domain-containing protein [Dyella lutea]MCP1376014.1 helix-turn-helix domain-containing protein [Dyella lutea]